MGFLTVEWGEVCFFFSSFLRVGSIEFNFFLGKMLLTTK